MMNLIEKSVGSKKETICGGKDLKTRITANGNERVQAQTLQKKVPLRPQNP